jgi:drug/metabolite transporter (DMT)-like permease
MTSSSPRSSHFSSSVLAKWWMETRRGSGIAAALSSAILLGFAPVFGKLAINLGFSPLAVVAWRTGLAAGIVLLAVALFWRRYLYIFPAGLYGCLLAGLINGAGSILYYLGLQRLPASLAQMLYSMYPFFVALWLILDGQIPSRLTFFRIALAIGAVVLLTSLQPVDADLIGVLMMLGAAALYALHLPINQRVLFEAPSPTVTLYTLLAMTAVVLPAYFLFDQPGMGVAAAWYPVLGLTMVTCLSRLALFLGVKAIGGMQTALLGLAELVVAVVLSSVWLRETLFLTQWLGALGLATSLLLVRFEPPHTHWRTDTRGWFAWIRPPSIPRDAPWGPHE